MAIPLYRIAFIIGACCLSFSTAKRDDLKDYTVNQLYLTETLNCNESKQYEDVANDSMPVSWMLPNLTVLYASSGRFIISPDNISLTVVNVTRHDLGQYHCMLLVPSNEKNSSIWYLARLGLNAQGPYFEDLWDKYETNTIIGLSAGFGFLALAIAAMLIWEHRYREPGEESVTSSDGVQPYSAYGDGKNMSTFSNEAYMKDDEAGRKENLENISQRVDSEPSTSDSSERAADESGTAF